MKKYFILLFILNFACAGSNTYNTVVHADKQEKKIDKLLVIGINKTDIHKGLFEKEVTERLKRNGYQAIAYSILEPSSTGIPREDKVKAQIEKNNFDGALVIQLKNVKQGKSFVANERYEGFYNYLNVFQSDQAYGYDQNHHTLVLESKIYNLKSKKMILALESETYLQEDIEATAGDFSNALSKEINKHKILTKN